MDKDKMYGFRFFKGVLGPLFRLYYNPTIVGSENIPDNGSILVVGNHIHIMDQCLPLLATKRPVHYIAKKEYFDNKKVAWFFKMAGCIPVDRSIKDANAKSEALKVLRAGYALGLFPEGTRNALKDEKIKSLYNICKNKYADYDLFRKILKKQRTSQVLYLEQLVKDDVISDEDFIDNICCVNEYLLGLLKNKTITKKDYENSLLLPFKFGAVSMAQKTDSYLIPFSISGDYKFRSKNLIVVIGKPFKVGKDLEKANEQLRNEVLRLIEKSKKMSGK